MARLIKETRGGLGIGVPPTPPQSRVRALEDGEEKPFGATWAPDGAEAHDWEND